MIKKIVALFLVLFLISGCAAIEKITNAPQNPVVEEPIKALIKTVEVDSGSYGNVVSDEAHIYIIYVKDKDIYAKKYYLDLSGPTLTLGGREFESQPVRVTRTENINEVYIQDFNNAIFRLNYVTDQGIYYYTESYRDFGLMNKKQIDKKELKLLDLLKVGDTLYKVSERNSKIIIEEFK